MHFTAWKRQSVIVAALGEIIQGKKESPQSYIEQFTYVIIEVLGAEEGLKCWIFENGLLRDHPFKLKIGRKKVRTTQEMLSMARSYTILEEKLNTHFDNPVFVNTKSIHPARKESHQQNGDIDRGMHDSC